MPNFLNFSQATFEAIDKSPELADGFFEVLGLKIMDTSLNGKGNTSSGRQQLHQSQRGRSWEAALPLLPIEPENFHQKNQP